MIYYIMQLLRMWRMKQAEYERREAWYAAITSLATTVLSELLFWTVLTIILLAISLYSCYCIFRVRP